MFKRLRALGRAVALTILVAAGMSVSIGSPAQAASRSHIVAVAQAEVGASEANGRCDKYGSPPYNCHNTEWCAMFIIWVWHQARVSPVFTTYTARAVGLWGQQQGLFKRRPAGGIGNPVPGDIAVFGEPGTTPGGHVGIVAAVNGDGTIDTINGNFTEAVQRANHIDPRTVTAGEDHVPISGYVSPPNVVPPPHDFSGDGVADVMGIRSNGELRYFPNNIASTGVPASNYLVTNQNFNVFSRVLAGDISGDGLADLLTVLGDSLYYYPNNIGSNPGGVPITTGIPTGGGGTGMSRMFLANFGGDGRADLLAITNSGEMRYFPNQLPNSSGAPYGPYVSVGPGWQTMSAIAVGDVSGDGVADLVATSSAGQLLYYPNNSGSNPNHVPFVNPILTGASNDLHRAFLSDVTGDGYADLVVVTTSGELRFYTNGILVNGVPFGASRPTGSTFGDVGEMTLADFSGDGVPDIVCVAGDRLRYYPNNIGSNPGGVPFTNNYILTGTGWSTTIMIG